MDNIGRLRHSVWECKYHLIWIPKCRRRVMYGQLRRKLGEVFHELARQKECRIEEGHLLADHVHILMSIPPKYSVAQVAVKVEKSSFSGFGSTTTTTTWSDPRRILRAENRGGHFIVFGDKAIIRVDKDGTLVWTHAWKYDNDQKNLQFDPTFVGANDDIVYACKGFHGIDGKTGEVKWADKDVKGEFYLVTDDLLVVEHKDKVRGYSLK